MALKDVKAKDVMIKKLLAISPDEKIALAHMTMIRNNIGGIPVVENGKLVGIITQRDILLARGYEIGRLSVRHLMTKDVITATPETPLKEVLGIMLDKKIERIPVVEDGKLVGLIVHSKILKKVHDSL
jgi:CBS domain-containing protein